MTNLLHISLAYKMAVIQLMVGEANFYAEKLNLPCSRPIQVSEVKSLVRPLSSGFGSFISTSNFFFSFNKDGKLWDVVRLKLFEGDTPYVFTSFVPHISELKKTPSLINKNEAYQMATQWLNAFSVNVPGLEQKHKPLVTQQQVIASPDSTNLITLPIYYVKWGNQENPAVEVNILGTTKELMELRTEDTSFSRRRPLIVTNAAELNSRPDPIPKTLSTSTNRVARPPTKGKTSNDPF
jgi:hypothetical protein